jgi:hypothetical protein
MDLIIIRIDFISVNTTIIMTGQVLRDESCQYFKEVANKGDVKYNSFFIRIQP